MQSLLFFNKEGDNLNFRYNQELEQWEGDLIFHENSNDTFKTIGIYTFEKVPSFEYQLPGSLKLDKFQLFNEYRFDIFGNSYKTQSIVSIEAVNNDSNFFSKWIYGEEFESKFPVGTLISFNEPLFEFSNPNLTYTVVQTKKNAILIISGLDNKQFNLTYNTQIGLTSSYTDKTISGVNSIGIYNYSNGTETNLSSWSEPDFYGKYFDGKKLTLLNTDKNDGVYTVNNVNLADKIYYRHQLDKDNFTQSNDLLIELVLKTEVPSVYFGDITLETNKINFSGTIPLILKPGIEFSIELSTLNSNALVVDSIPQFTGNTNYTYYATSSQVIWESNIYQCVQAYYWNATSSITPASASYWSSPTYLPITTTLATETVNQTNIYLTTNKIYYEQRFTYSSASTLASAAEFYKDDLKLFNIDLYYENLTLYADLIYPSEYAIVNFYGITNSTFTNQPNIADKKLILEQNVGIEETLKPEVNENINSNFIYNIIFTDLDEFGLKITIDGQVYQQEINWVYVGTSPNLPRTIDRTLRAWLSRHFARLVSLGVIPTLQYAFQYVGIASNLYYNSINLKTQYPNVPLDFSVEVGTTADFYIQHSEVIFFDCSNYLIININGKDYGQSVTLTNGTPDIPTALSGWTSDYQDELADYGIYVESLNSLLTFKIKEQNQRLDYTIKTGKTDIPGIPQYKRVDKIKGQFGSTLTSNEIALPKQTTGSTFSFETFPFSTGQVVSINNTNKPYNNQEYNLLYIGPTSLVLSYQGPFWATVEPRCEISPFVSLAFSGGFGATGCLPPISPTVSNTGEFVLDQFEPSFSLNLVSINSYSSTSTSISNVNIKDILYLQLSASIYILGASLTILDAVSLRTTNTIALSMNNPIEALYNPINSYLYCYGSEQITIVDPLTDTIIATIADNTTLQSKQIQQIVANTTNGDIYVQFVNDTDIWIWDKDNTTTTETTQITITGNVIDLAYNDFEKQFFVSSTDLLTTVDGPTRTIDSTITVVGITSILFYEPINSWVYYFDASNLKKIKNGTIIDISFVTTDTTFTDFIFNNYSGNIIISKTTIIQTINLDDELVSSVVTSSYGPMTLSQFDGDVYLANQTNGKILVIDNVLSTVKHTQNFLQTVNKVIYNPDRQSIIGVQPSVNNVVEIGVFINSEIIIENPTYSNISEGFGSLDPNYQPKEDLWLKTREYIRKPRENYNDEVNVKYVWKWKTDEYPEMFLYDFSGDQLPITGSYAYTGTKPLTNIVLNKNPNRVLERVSLPEFQQTIFNEIIYTLDHVDSSDNLSFLPEPLETFIGFRSDDEGPVQSNLILYKREEIEFTISSSSQNNNIINFKLIEDSKNGNYGIITLDTSSQTTFLFDDSDVTRSLKVGQIIRIYITDNTNTKRKYASINHGKTLKIRKLSSRQIIVDFVRTYDSFVNESTKISNYPTSGKTTYLNVRFKVQDKSIGQFRVMGQTEIEDERYRIELTNTGHNLGPEDVYIFKPYDINEQGVDWTYLNQKRKEMLMVRNDIFPYVGSYKAIINAINLFGYNDLELYEYYRNINVNSPDFYKLFKVEIPDIFDNTVEGWTINDFIKHTMPNPNFEDTNLFNLTYRITDKEGNNVLLYSLAEVIIKLQGLKYWLQRKVIPITHKILDITGKADFVGVDTITHRNYDAKILNVRQNMTPVDFSLNEAYLMPVNSGSTVYTCHIDFTTATSSASPDYFTIKIRTYQTHKEWNPFTTYVNGDRIIYYGQLYESVIDNNKLKNPRKYDTVSKWRNDFDYIEGQLALYDEHIYQYIGTQSSFIIYGTQSTVSPYSNVISEDIKYWFDMTEWKKINYHPVQTLSEYRLGNATHSYNFTIDSNIDPFIVIEVTSDNGYGQIYTSKKNYEIRGLNDLYTGFIGDQILPFEPIIQLTVSVI